MQHAGLIASAFDGWLCLLLPAEPPTLLWGTASRQVPSIGFPMCWPLLVISWLSVLLLVQWVLVSMQGLVGGRVWWCVHACMCGRGPLPHSS